MCKTKLILFASKSGNLANYVAKHFIDMHPLTISPEDDLEVVFHHLIHSSIRYKLFGISVGYNKLIPKDIIDLFEGTLYNVHPGSLPLTKGLYGDKVISKMVESYQRYCEIIIHQVDEQYDNGRIIDSVIVPYLEKVIDGRIISTLQDKGLPITPLGIQQYTTNYKKMLKLVEPTFVCKFIDKQLNNKDN